MSMAMSPLCTRNVSYSLVRALLRCIWYHSKIGKRNSIIITINWNGCKKGWMPRNGGTETNRRNKSRYPIPVIPSFDCFFFLLWLSVAFVKHTEAPIDELITDEGNKRSSNNHQERLVRVPVPTFLLDPIWHCCVELRWFRDCVSRLINFSNVCSMCCVLCRPQSIPNWQCAAAMILFDFFFRL